MSQQVCSGFESIGFSPLMLLGFTCLLSAVGLGHITGECLPSWTSHCFSSSTSAYECLGNPPKITPESFQPVDRIHGIGVDSVKAWRIDVQVFFLSVIIFKIMMFLQVYVHCTSLLTVQRVIAVGSIDW